jgi:hypothetical protein
VTCPACHCLISPRDGVAHDGTTTVHGRCYGKPFASMADQTAPQDILDEIATVVERMLAVPKIGDETDEQWRRGRGRNVAHRLGMDFRIARRAGVVPEVIRRGDTEDLELPSERTTNAERTRP